MALKKEQLDLNCSDALRCGTRNPTCMAMQWSCDQDQLLGALPTRHQMIYSLEDWKMGNGLLVESLRRERLLLGKKKKESIWMSK